MIDLRIFNAPQVRRIVEELEEKLSAKNQRINELGEENQKLAKENESLRQEAARWRCLMRLVDECKVSVLFEGESDTIDGGLIETDLGEIAERIDAAIKESEDE